MDCVAEKLHRKSDELERVVHRMEEELQRQVDETQAGEASPDRRTVLESIQRFLDILRSMNPEI